MALAKVKPFPLLPAALMRSPWVQNPLVILAVNWLFQGMRGMGRRELSFRLLLELLLSAIAAVALHASGVTAPRAAVLGWMAAHSFQFLFNGQFWVCLRYARFWRRDPERLRRWLEALAADLRRLPWLREALVIGSLGRHPPGRRSDLDLRLFFPPGPWNWLRLNLLLLRLRCRAFCAAIPLDLYAPDDPRALARIRPGEPVRILLDRDERLRRSGGRLRGAAGP